MRQRPRIFAIVNPAAGGGRGARLARTIAAEFEREGTVVEVAVTPAAGEGARIAALAVDEGYQTILAVGGDGTANEVANGLIGSMAALALYPIGKGNDLARSLGYPRGRKGKQLARWLTQEAKRRSIDVGEANGRIFLNAAGVGIDGHVAERVRSASGFGYFVASLGAVATYRPRKMDVNVDGERSAGRFLTVVASNGQYFGGGMRPAPRAKMDDGLLDVTLAGDLSKLASFAALARIYLGRHENGTTVVTRTARAVEIELEKEGPLQIDGEATRADRVEIRIRPKALAVLAVPEK